ncbi:hypothetical protein ALI22I_06270 [Saccharothrix sp. ALI-22-I]|uniref:TetR family transcriptional regulator C-terminal domain-containing protein n=1 Tax=Saccharothrix sp. ALI-22-I TaxID=1933778 RepID=UPI00097C3E1B|nr:TetR family transcriptional regulator C-terminal domain-containing protein [Saccharothrix sp. ALI-22-I]ONI92036.1 hypothetical protein ALI22I_06270 [Saccharothrix sp. ALI-22-I]
MIRGGGRNRAGSVRFRPHRVTERYERLRKQVGEYLSGAQREGRIRADRDPGQAAAVLLALLDGLQIQWLYNRDVDMIAAFDAFYETWLTPPVGVTDEPGDTQPQGAEKLK